MKALSKQKSEVGIWMIDAPVPEIGPDDVLVKIKKTGICERIRRPNERSEFLAEVGEG